MKLKKMKLAQMARVMKASKGKRLSKEGMKRQHEFSDAAPTPAFIMLTTDKAKKLAANAGYELIYNRSGKHWDLSKSGCSVGQFTKDTLASLGEAAFLQQYVR